MVLIMNPERIFPIGRVTFELTFYKQDKYLYNRIIIKFSFDVF